MSCTYPILLNEVKQVSISKLKEFGYMKPQSIKSGRLIWSSRGQEVGSINIIVNMKDDPYALLEYTFNKEEKVSYQVNLVSVPSNLGKGKVWYFVCPHTGKMCRKLYGANKYFLHREAYPDAMYECQTYSKREGLIDKVCKVMYGSDKLYKELYSKHFKTHYANKPTKRYKKIMNELDFIRQNQDQAFKTFLTEFNRE